ncbi:Helix-turn-helix domain-containing protein [Alkalispirochaeta americana]|uniref:Helix-turn-helix domain-containing protein n=1 Tax=Alkalispirochaeta americana TaxID=159291 RepID=A0A1N6XR98_9SPIO|nr:GntR family transcriptional regulator YhfZ [Alkalispirochaeta americana]SIR04833.1 Helix-turn-helix domain-containing protein [Alkalispirochaeta americana]
MQSSKHLHLGGQTLVKLAEDMLGRAEGDRIESVSGYSRRLSVAVGTVQKALKELEDLRAVVLQGKGHMGSFVKNINYDRLYSICGISTIIFSLPLPYTKRLEAVATGFFKHFHTSYGSVSFELSYMRGSRQRVNSLMNNRSDGAVISRLAADILIKEGFPIEIVAGLGPGSYLSSHGLIFSGNDCASVKSLGVDPMSLDQTVMTERFLRESGLYINLVEIPYSQIIENIKTGVVDGTIWNRDYVVERIGELNFRELSSPGADEASTEAVLVINSDNLPVRHFIKRNMDIEKVTAAREGVIKGTLLPEY